LNEKRKKMRREGEEGWVKKDEKKAGDEQGMG
jgi:hypothetical protein